jgi:hypothetical protein
MLRLRGGGRGGGIQYKGFACMIVEHWRGRECRRRYGRTSFMGVHEVRFRVISKTVSFWKQSVVCQSVCAIRHGIYPLQSCSVTNGQKENSFHFVDLDVVNFNSNKSPTRYNNFLILLSWRLFTAQHVSGDLTPIIKSSTTAVAASGFTVGAWW